MRCKFHGLICAKTLNYTDLRAKSGILAVYNQRMTELIAEETPPTPTFAELGLDPAIVQAITDTGYTTPTPIQAAAIPVVVTGKDLKACAQTGTGKTAAFSLPLLQRLLPHANSSTSPAKHPVRALILTPTRELAIQVYDNLKEYGKYLPYRIACVYGGTDIKPQIAELKLGVEFLVATPGRFLDLVEQKAVSLHSVQALVLDEADRMLDMGFIPDIQRILNMLPKTRQGLLFSATFSTEIQRLADTMLQNPEYIEVAKRNSVSDTITHQVHPVAESRKMALLVNLLRTGTMNQALVFVRTKQGCSRLARALQHAGIKTDAIHGDKSQSERMKALNAFKAGEMQALVATDVAARGIDIEELPYVVNYELPHTPEDYVHRIGRTGRAGNLGNALSLVSADETGYLADIEKLINKPIHQVVVPGFEPEDDWCYPPSGKKRDRSALNSNRGAERNERTERNSRSERNERTERRPDRAERPQQDRSRSHYTPKPSTIAADGFDFNKPYQATVSNADAMPTAEKPSTPMRRSGKMVAALLGGIKKPQP
ncbi:MAG: ATP-dependent helicase RhlE [Pseudomonadota bacterium]|jgi:ATP-dependent RNA helicase RhlE